MCRTRATWRAAYHPGLVKPKWCLRAARTRCGRRRAGQRWRSVFGLLALLALRVLVLLVVAIARLGLVVLSVVGAGLHRLVHVVCVVRVQLRALATRVLVGDTYTLVGVVIAVAQHLIGQASVFRGRFGLGVVVVLIALVGFGQLGCLASLGHPADGLTVRAAPFAPAAPSTTPAALALRAGFAARGIRLGAVRD